MSIKSVETISPEPYTRTVYSCDFCGQETWCRCNMCKKDICDAHRFLAQFYVLGANQEKRNVPNGIHDYCKKCLVKLVDSFD